MKSKRITRLIKLLHILQSGSGRNVAWLANECKVSRRTLFRDLATLKDAGLPISFDVERDRYSLPNSYFLPPVNFTTEEALSLMALAGEMGQSDRLPFYEPARVAAFKLERVLPVNLRSQLRAATGAIRIRPSPVCQLHDKRNYYRQLVDARVAKQVVRITYQLHSGRDPIATKLRPYFLLFCRHSWYVIGRSSNHSCIRAFNLRRITSLEVTNEFFEIPKGYGLERFQRNAWTLSPGEGADQLVEIKFSPMVARNVAEINWHRTQKLTFKSDGSLTFRALVSGLNEILWWVLAFGDQAEVIRPATLRRLLVQRARNMVRLYDGIATR